MQKAVDSGRSDLVFGRWLQPILNEFDITCRLLSSNASLGFGLYFIGLVPRVLAFPETVGYGRLFVEVLFAALANEYVFDICNQTMSPDEDRRNRPDRPIPAGLLTVDGAFNRWVLWWAGSPLVLLAMGCPVAALHLVNFEVWSFFCYVWPKPGHPFWKNLYTPVALFFSLRILNGVITPHAARLEMPVSFDAMFAAWLFATIHVQDFHDIEGDRASGRRTLPIVLSPVQLVRLRQATAVAMVGAATLLVVLGFRLCEAQYNLWVGLFAALQFAGGVATGLYFLLTSSAREGEITYKWLHIPTALLIIAYLSLVNGSMTAEHA